MTTLRQSLELRPFRLKKCHGVNIKSDRV
jgi:hypothetical protein